KITDKQSERADYADLVSRAKDIEAGYKAWQKARKDLEKWEETALQFREHDEKRQPLLREIEVEKARLEQEKQELEKQWTVVNGLLATVDELEKQLNTSKISLQEVE